MKLQTIVDKPVSDWKIVPQSNILVLGSCFAERVGEIAPMGVEFLNECLFDSRKNEAAHADYEVESNEET